MNECAYCYVAVRAMFRRLMLSVGQLSIHACLPYPKSDSLHQPEFSTPGLSSKRQVFYGFNSGQIGRSVVQTS